MNSTLKTIATGACVGLVCLALAACGGGNEGDDNSNGNGSSTGSNANAETASIRITEDFVTHMANREYADAQQLVKAGGGADVLNEYVRLVDEQAASGNPAANVLYDLVYAQIDERFAEAGVELVEQGEDSATVRVTLGDQAYDVTVSTLDGSDWTIEIPNGMLTPFGDLLNVAGQRAQQQNQGANP